MATSHFYQIQGVMQYVELLWPDSVLDIGAGVGKWGFLCRDRLEFLEGRYRKDSWRTKVYGIEIYDGYRNPIWEYYYDRFWVGNVLDVLDEVPGVELVLLADVLSFLTKQDGQELLGRLKRKGRYLLVSTPAWFCGSSDGKHDHTPATANHLSFWQPADFAANRAITHRHGNTNFILVDLKSKGVKPLRIESAEQYPLGTLARAMALKMLRRLGFSTMGTVTLRGMREQFISKRTHVTQTGDQTAGRA